MILNIIKLDTSTRTKLENIDSNTTDISSLRTDVDSNTTDIASLQSSVDSNTTDITSLQSTVDSNTTDIASLQASVDSNTADITSLRTHVDSNTADIASLQSSVDSNTADIAAIEGRVNMLESGGSGSSSSGSGGVDTSGLQDNIDSNTDAIAAIDSRVTTLETVTHANLSLGAAVYAIWAEENADLGGNQSEWAFGNGANTTNIRPGGGVVICFRSRLIGMSLNVGDGNSNSVTFTVTVQATKNGYDPVQNPEVATVTVTGENLASTYVDLRDTDSTDSNSKLIYNKGDVIGFRTSAASPGSATDRGIVTAWFQTIEE